MGGLPAQKEGVMGFLLPIAIAALAALGFGGSGPVSDVLALGPGLPFIDVLGRPSGNGGGGRRRRRRKMLTASDISVIASLAGLVGASIAGKAALVRIARN